MVFHFVRTSKWNRNQKTSKDDSCQHMHSLGLPSPNQKQMVGTQHGLLEILYIGSDWDWGSIQNCFWLGLGFRDLTPTHQNRVMCTVLSCVSSTHVRVVLRTCMAEVLDLG